MKKVFGVGIILLTIFYLVSCSAGQNPGCPDLDIDQAVAMAVKAESGSYAPGEVVTEGHLILETEEDEGLITLYTLASYGEFGFENGIFTKVSGSGAIPTIIKFFLDENGEYTLLGYQVPVDGEGYIDSIKEMFPRRLHPRVLAADLDYPALAAQQEAQAEEYLKSIGREAPVSEAYVEKELAVINVEASNKLFAEPSFDSFLGNCPYWLGTAEKIEGGVRYIYETSQSKTADGYDLITFQKKKEDGPVIEERKYKIVGSEPQLIDIRNEGAEPLIYNNTEYGFTFSLPEPWRGYTIVIDQWEGSIVDSSPGDAVLETGALISLRHPRWTAENPRQDIPIMVLTLTQWAALQRGEIHIGAAPIGPKELGRNSKYVFTLPARYNYAFPTGYEEVEDILNNNPLQVTEKNG